MSSSVEVLPIGEPDELHEIDAREDSWHIVRWGVIEADSSVAIDVEPLSGNIFPFRLKVLSREKATDVFEHPFSYLPGRIALTSSVFVAGSEAA